MWRRRRFHGINAMILMPQIFDVTANENARFKRNELEFHINGVLKVYQKFKNYVFVIWKWVNDCDFYDKWQFYNMKLIIKANYNKIKNICKIRKF